MTKLEVAKVIQNKKLFLTLTKYGAPFAVHAYEELLDIFTELCLQS